MQQILDFNVSFQKVVQQKIDFIFYLIRINYWKDTDLCIK